MAVVVAMVVVVVSMPNQYVARRSVPAFAEVVPQVVIRSLVVAAIYAAVSVAVAVVVVVVVSLVVIPQQ